MKFLRKLKDSAKGVPLLVWALGAVVPFGLTAIALYIAYKSAQKPKLTISEQMAELVNQIRPEDLKAYSPIDAVIKAEKDTKND